MREMKEIGTSGMKLLPPKEGTCEVCATTHDPAFPHNQQSLYYQYAFYADHGVWPTWGDALEHCEPQLREDWTRILKEEHGIGDDQFIPTPKEDKADAVSSL